MTTVLSPLGPLTALAFEGAAYAVLVCGKELRMLVGLW